MTEWWQHIPASIDPIVFAVGSFSLRWYPVFFILGWVAATSFLSRRIRRDGHVGLDADALLDSALVAFAGAVVGGRLGYALLYDPSLFSHPLSIVSPFDDSGAWKGIWGMSFHGALFGVAVALVLFARIRKIDFWVLSDALALATPMALFFGRIGNFFNHELVGRVTERPFGMYFSDEAILRHPSQLYEAFFEGVILFICLFFIGKRRLRAGYMSIGFLFLYGCMRFFLEFLREPDKGVDLIFGWMTVGQTLSLVLVAISVAILGFLSKRNDGILKRK